MCSVYKQDKPSFENDPLAVLFTSDSAGDPKAVFRTRENIVAEATKVKDALGYDTDTTILAAVPLFSGLRVGPRLRGAASGAFRRPTSRKSCRPSA